MSRSLYARLHRRFGPRISGAELQRRIRQKVDGFQARVGERLADRPAREGVRGRVVIVGGGFAGLMAGYVLSSDFAVTVLEARDRLGGRVRSRIDETSKRIIEAGAELI